MERLRAWEGATVSGLRTGQCASEGRVPAARQRRPRRKTGSASGRRRVKCARRGGRGVVVASAVVVGSAGVMARAARRPG
ncbi:hypothetical protein GUJ93_ZPchr0013g34343 [Zizania palustris]|uniref:Uncharacterized protein n=1 Tax=Zizania palustris TaxID=103762 RepID=A0A8J6C134_ZIZPA|nr:hypothetical protein GUJ93_ZPchr0013g34343 [Zizania palustris]